MKWQANLRMSLRLGHGSVPSPEVALDDDALADGGGCRGKPGLVAAAVRVVPVVPAELGPPGPLPAHRHGLLAWSSVDEAREAAQAPAAADVELLPRGRGQVPRGRGQDGVVVAKMLQQGQLLEVDPPKTWKLETRRRLAIVVENCLEIVAEEDVERDETWQRRSTWHDAFQPRAMLQPEVLQSTEISMSQRLEMRQTFEMRDMCILQSPPDNIKDMHHPMAPLELAFLQHMQMTQIIEAGDVSIV